MPDPEVREDLRRWLRQRLAAGDREWFLPAEYAAAARIQGSPTARPEPPASSSFPVPAWCEPAPPPSREPAAAALTLPEGDSLEQIAAEVRACKRCRLHQTRTQAVPGAGPAAAGLVFVGEGPGAEEDARGEPFVGAAGQLLTKIIEAVQLRRDQVFITNIVKCRPPGNRDPQPDEVAACEPYLRRQLAVLQPQVICALGRHAGAALTGVPASMASLRTGEHRYAGIRVFPTYHPAACLRNPQWKRPVWEDIQKVRREYDAPRENS